MLKKENCNAWFHHVSILVDDYEKALAFYEALGMEKYLEWDENGQNKCFLDTCNGPFLEMTQGKPGEAGAGQRFQHYCLYVDNTDAFIELAEKNGAKVLTPAGDYPLTCLDGRKVVSRAGNILAPGGEMIEIINWPGYEPAEYEKF